tara:strand:+ start:3084 stop:3521 length:438 start_codon:yes stop_codon:yes gene_type:complete
MMFGWLRKKKKTKDNKVGPEQVSDENLEGLIVASMRYVLGVDGTIYLEFLWDSDVKEDANEAFSVLFSQINSGDLFEQSMGFIEETLESTGEEDEFARFYQNVLLNQHAKIQPILDSLAMGQQSDDEVVVKPTDIAYKTFKGNQT